MGGDKRSQGKVELKAPFLDPRCRSAVSQTALKVRFLALLNVGRGYFWGCGGVGGLCRAGRSPEQSGLKVLVDCRNVGHDALPVRPLCVHHIVDVLESRAGNTVDVMREDPRLLLAAASDAAAGLTKVHLMPTLSAAWKARVKFLLCDMKRSRVTDWSVVYPQHR